jgi:hypothetical protein
MVVALNNATGAPYFTREQMAEIDDRFAAFQMNTKQVATVVDQSSPFKLQKQNGLCRSFEVFTENEGIYVVTVVLGSRNGSRSSHAIAVDRDRNVINFGLNDDGDDQITLRPDGFETETVGAAKEGLLKHFSDLVAIEVADVWRVQVKTKRLEEVPHAALLPPVVAPTRAAEDEGTAGDGKRHCPGLN